MLDDKRLDKSKLEELATRFIHKMPLEECQVIAIVQNDKEPKRIHLCVNRN